MTRLPFNPSLIKPPVEEARPASSVMMSVTQLTQMIKRTLEERLPSTIHVVGQVSNFKRHSSGHFYFVLKDERSELSCVLWRSDAARLKFAPTDGLEVVATGHIDLFERTGRYQLYARRVEPRGVGALELAFRQLRDRLEREGLFDPTRKRFLPRLPKRLAVVTSLDGAALRDIVQTLRRRFACVDVLVYPVTVQGPSAAGEIASAIGLLNANASRLGGVDVMIVGRGGGSLEDLWAFNEEVVARAIHASGIPVISAVGHESDMTISDLVADVRAATPTAAAELATPNGDELSSHLGQLFRHLRRRLLHTVQLGYASLAVVEQRAMLRRPMDIVRRREEAADELSTRLRHTLTDRLHRLRRRMGDSEVTILRIAPNGVAGRLRARIMWSAHRLERAATRHTHSLERRLTERAALFAELHPHGRLDCLHETLHQLSLRLESLDHRNVLRRGFTLTRLARSGRLVRSASEVLDGDTILTETTEGSFKSRRVPGEQKELFDES